MTKKDEMAFPCQSRWDAGNESMDLYSDATGLTKREYFAAMAMQGFAAAPEGENTTIEGVAKYSVKWADALIDALNADNT